MSSASRDSRRQRHYGPAVNTSVLTILVLLGACGSGGTSLEGTFECGAYLCNSGELCRTLYYGIDSTPDSGPLVGCVAPSCEVEDCYGDECAPCVIQECGGCSTCTRLVGRELTCAGQ